MRSLTSSKFSFVGQPTLSIKHVTQTQKAPRQVSLWQSRPSGRSRRSIEGKPYCGNRGEANSNKPFLTLVGDSSRFQGTMEPKRGGGAYRTCACLNIDALVDGPWARIFHGPHPPEDAWNPTKHDCAKQYFQKPTWMTYSALRRIERRQGHPGKLGTICIKLDLGNNA